jgi:NTE family protein
MRTAFVLSGGASLGAVEAGMARALAHAGVRPDVLFGTSVGAVNCAFLAGHPGPDGADLLADTWRTLRRDEVFPIEPRKALLGVLGRRDHIVSNVSLQGLIERHLTFERLEDAPIPLHVVATDVVTGGDRLFSSGDAAKAVLASAAIPGVFPPVEIDGKRYMDGGVTANTPIAHAVASGVDVVYVLPTGHACATNQAPRGALGMMLQAITVMIGRQLVIDIERFRSRVELRVVPTLCPLDVMPIDFSHTDELLERAYDSTRTWIAAGEPAEAQAHLLAGHRHVTPLGP